MGEENEEREEEAERKAERKESAAAAKGCASDFPSATKNELAVNALLPSASASASCFCSVPTSFAFALFSFSSTFTWGYLYAVLNLAGSRQVWDRVVAARDRGLLALRSEEVGDKECTEPSPTSLRPSCR